MSYSVCFMNSTYCYTLSLKNAHHHKYFGNEQCCRSCITQTWAVLERVKSRKDKLEDQRELTYFPPTAMRWVNKSEFKGITKADLAEVDYKIGSHGEINENDHFIRCLCGPQVNT